MFNLVRAYLYKTTKSKIFWVLLALTTCSAIAMFCIAYGIGNNTINESISNVGFLLSDMNMMSIVGAVLATTLICSDFDTKNIHHPIISGFARIQIVISKAIVFWILLIVLVSPYIIVTIIGLSMDSTFSMGGKAAGFLSILTLTTSGIFGEYVTIVITMMMVYLAQLTICILLAFALRKSVLVVAAYYMMSMFFGQVASFQNSFEMMNKILSFTPYSVEYITLNLSMSKGDIISAVSVCAMFIVVVLYLTYMTFRKAEIR
ncbi:ABC transporter permease [Lysinibacillus sp. NPDC093692]|uniref:ABC transporter permease n=1 Tax=Lysinibacillus sp. NPDC093692 TaxID=3390578 RepID=UPI003CFC4500